MRFQSRLPIVFLAASSAWAAVDFAREVQPILHARCSACHSGDKPAGALNVLTRAGLVRGGVSGPAIQPGAGTASLLIRRVTAEAARMPLGQTPLADREVAVLREWIDSGAAWNPDAAMPVSVNTRVQPVRPDIPAGAHSNPIDAFVERYQRRKGVGTPAVVDDAAYARRVWFDLLGLPPSPEHLDRFVRSREAEKRAALVDSLLRMREPYAEHWMSFWNDLLRNEQGVSLPGEQREWITGWLQDALKNNAPYDRMARELLNPQGKGAPRGFIAGVNWGGDVSASQTIAMQAAQNTAQVFLGANLRCASCHDSFVSRWKLAQTYGLAAYFSAQPTELVRCEIKTGVAAAPAFLFSELQPHAPAAAVDDRRAELARMIATPANGRFAATLINRYWKLLFGRALVEPVDDIEAPAWDADLLNWLAADFTASGYDLQKLLRRIMTSRAYQMQSAIEEAPARAGDEFVFRGPNRRRLSAEQFCDAVSAITGEWKALDDLSGQPAPFARRWRFHSDPLTRALGRSERLQVITERSADANTLQALELIDGKELQTQLRRGARRLTGSFREAPANAADSGQVRMQRVTIEADIRGADRVWLLLTDSGSFDRDKVLTGWSDAEFEGPAGTVRLRDLPLPEGVTLRPIQVKGEAPRETLAARVPSRIVYDIAGRGFTKFRATAGVDESCLRPDINGRVRFFVFTREPVGEELVRTAGEAPAPRPQPSRGEALVRQLFRYAVAREPGRAELADARKLVDRGTEGVEDLLWILFVSPEFQWIR